MARLRQANVAQQKHILDNEIWGAMKSLIRDKYKMDLKLVSPGYLWRNATKVAIQNFKAHSLSILTRMADNFPLQLWD